MFSGYTVILDSCVLYPAQLRDSLLTLAGIGLYRARWTATIHEEWIGAVLENNPRIPREVLERTRANMDAAVQDCLVTGYEPFIRGLDLPDPDDRHVLAAAIVGGADAIVTANLRHFPEEYLATFGVEPISPDDFVVHQFGLDEELVVRALSSQRKRLVNPPVRPGPFLASLGRHLPKTTELLAKHLDRL